MVTTRSILNFVVLLCLAVSSHGAVLAVTPSAHVKEGEHADAMTTSLTNKARTDVQIRRIKNLIISGESRDERSIDKLQALQRKLRGES